MRNVSGSTNEEKRLIKSVQGCIGAVKDGSIGTQTMSDIACKLNADCFPLALTIYDQPVIIAKDIIPAKVAAPLSAYANAISGGFSYQRKPCSIMVTNGTPVCGYACHAHLNKKESVLYRRASGAFGVKRAMYASELPCDVRWAVGGVGLLDFYNPKVEGFVGAYADVLRKTAHTVVGMKNGYVYLIYVANMNAEQVNAYAQKLGLEMAVMLDGGHIAAINSADKRINTGTIQYSIIQAK